MATSRLTEAKKRIRELGLRVTAPRVAVLEAVAGAGRTLSHAEVVERLGPDALWDRVTVYRNLVALVGVKLLRIARRSDDEGDRRMTATDAAAEIRSPAGNAQSAATRPAPTSSTATGRTSSLAQRATRTRASLEALLRSNAPDRFSGVACGSLVCERLSPIPSVNGRQKNPDGTDR
jgi:hypothetical protein